MEEEFKHMVFTNDPVKLFSFIDSYVEIHTKNNTYIRGFVITIDPVSESVILSTADINNIFRTVLVVGQAVEEITKIDAPPDLESKFKSYNTRFRQCNKGSEERRYKIMHWLSKNLLAVEVLGNNIQIQGGSLTIMPPYRPEDCVCSNSTVLGRIQHLLQKMPI